MRLASSASRTAPGSARHAASSKVASIAESYARALAAVKPGSGSPRPLRRSLRGARGAVLQTLRGRAVLVRENPEDSTMARKYSKKAQRKVKRAMHERKRGTLRSGRSGKKVTSRKQAIAIGLSQARKAGAKVPRKPGRSKPSKRSKRR